MEEIDKDSFIFEEQCIVDEAKVFYNQNRVYRAIYNTEQAALYEQLFRDIDFKILFNAGLVSTKIASDISMDNCKLILEHERLDYFIDPSEMTNKMFWDAANCFININKILARHQLILKDAHPWNITFQKAKPIFFDFSSIGYSEVVSPRWLNEFYTYFVVPLGLAHSKWSYLSLEYRRQHLNGFGLKLSEHSLVKKYLFRSFFRLSKNLNQPVLFFDRLEKWLLNFQPVKENGIWDSYNQSHESDYLNPTTLKQKFVYNILEKHKPFKVTDLATNKGYYAFMAESLGANVIGFDYEAYSVDVGNQLVADQNISFCQMNFLTPTSRRGWGLMLPSAFERFQSTIALALGLIHHICLVQRFPVKLFCDSCAKYATTGVILEFVYPDDKHVKEWNVIIPLDYNIDSIKKYFSSHYKMYQESELMNESGVMRQFLFFYSI